MKIRELSDNWKYEENLRNILEQCDDDFNPSLSQRYGTRQTDFEESAQSTIDGYFLRMMKQKIIAAFDESEIIGLISYTDTTPDSIGDNDAIYTLRRLFYHLTEGKE